MLLTICQISSIVAIELKLLFFKAIQLATDVFPLNHAVDTLFNFHRIDSNLMSIAITLDVHKRYSETTRSALQQPYFGIRNLNTSIYCVNAF